MSPTAPAVLTLKQAILGGGHTTPIERLAATERKALDVARAKAWPVVDMQTDWIAI